MIQTPTVDIKPVYAPDWHIVGAPGQHNAHWRCNALDVSMDRRGT